MLRMIAVCCTVGILLGTTSCNQSQKNGTADKDVTITLTRTPCFGTCPEYQLTILGDGSVTYVGTRNVSVVGTHSFQISEEKVQELVDAFYACDYFNMEAKYEYKPTPIGDEPSGGAVAGGVKTMDLPSTITSITIGGETKEVVNYHSAPQGLIDLEKKIDEYCDAGKYVAGE